MKPPVSIIIPAYNAGPFLDETFSSVQQQTFGQFEAIIVDDGSTDQTAEVAQKFAAQDPRFILLRQSRAGASAARNAAVKRAHGEWIAFLDADDVWLPTKLAAQIELSKQEPKANFLFTDHFYWDGRNDLSRRYHDDRKFPNGDVGRGLIFFNLFGPLTVMVRRETLDAAGPFDTDLKLAEDWDCWLRIADQGLCVKGVRQSLARYRRWPGQKSGNAIPMQEQKVRVLEKALARPQGVSRRKVYERSLQIARGNLELAKIRPLLEQQPDVVSAAAWRAWRHCPTRMKWLFWYFATLWPHSRCAGIVYQKIRNKW
jgi:glycosyltransferase involved in cell wall biosynthesis